MRIDSRLYDTGYEVDDLPLFICTECKKGNLRVPRNGIKIYEYPSSKRRKNDPKWHYFMIEGNFNGTLVCDNKKCGCVAVISGNSYVDNIVEEHGMAGELVDHIAIRFFDPAPEIIPIENYVTEENIITCLKESFKSFWGDTSACAGKIRNVVAAIMDAHNVSKNKPGGGYLPLDKRIETFGKSTGKEEIAENLLAIKWIGNDGTHDKISNYDVLFAYEIVYYSLDKLYNPRPSYLKKRVKEINKNKGIRYS